MLFRCRFRHTGMGVGKGNVQVVNVSVSTIRGGGDTMISSPGRSPKQKTTPSGDIGPHYPLHGRQACPEFNFFHEGVGQLSPREGLFLCRPFSKQGQICDIPALPQSSNDSCLLPCHVLVALGSGQPLPGGYQSYTRA